MKHDLNAAIREHLTHVAMTRLRTALSVWTVKLKGTPRPSIDSWFTGLMGLSGTLARLHRRSGGALYYESTDETDPAK
jgi:hypothetical protein